MKLITRKEAKAQGLSRYYTGVPCKHGHDCERKTVNSTCIECESIGKKKCVAKNPEKYKHKCREWYERNREDQLSEQRQRRRENPELYKKRDRRKYEKNKEVALERNKRYYERHKDYFNRQTREYRLRNKEHITTKNKEWYERNKDELKRWRDENKEVISERRRLSYINNKDRETAYRINNKDRYAAHAAKRRAMKKNATPPWFSYEVEDIDTLYEIASYWSDVSGTEHHVDHIVPLQSDVVCGLHCLDNLQILTADENQSKSNKFYLT